MKCPICNKEIGAVSEVVEHINYSHFLNYLDYVENNTLSWLLNPSPTCYSCGTSRMPLTWLERDFYYIPCRECLKRKTDLAEVKNEIIKNIKLYYKKIHFKFILR